MASLLLYKSMLFANAVHKSKKKKKVKLKKVLTKSKKLNMSMCRICNSEKGDIPIFENFVQPNIPEEIMHFSGVTMSKSDNLPQQMCQNCLDLLNGCIMFRDMCQQTNKDLIELSIKKEITNCESTNYSPRSNYVDDVLMHHNSDEESYNLPSPAFSDSSELWACFSCNTEFYNLESYNIHLKNCKKQKRDPKQPRDRNWKKQSFLCDICGKTAKSKASLSVHMGIHENVFPFKCEECPYQGRTMDLLKVHKRSHLVDKPFKCSQCPKATTTSSNLAKHMRHVHSTTRPFKCAYCEKGFSYQHDMKRHIKDIHLRQGTVECDICFKKFNTKKILQGHRWKIHKIKGERQGRIPSYLQHLQGQLDAEDNCDPDLNYAKQTVYTHNAIS